MAARSEPFELVFNSELVIDETANAVVVALVVVEFPVMTRFPLIVEEAAERKPVLKRVMREVVGARKPFESTNQSRLLSQ